MTLGELAKHEGSMEHQALKVWLVLNPLKSSPIEQQIFREGFRAAYALWRQSLDSLKDQLDV